jgi:hypothetical protein
MWAVGSKTAKRKINQGIKLKALTIKQPWVHAILHEGKDVENRSWRRSFRGWLAIHAAATPNRHAVFPRGVRMPDLAELDYSAIVAIARIADIRDSARSRWFDQPAPREINYGWMLKDVRKLEKPILCKGALGLWNVPESIVANIRSTNDVGPALLGPEEEEAAPVGR